MFDPVMLFLVSLILVNKVGAYPCGAADVAYFISRLLSDNEKKFCLRVRPEPTRVNHLS
jgi:hypothetical protein